MAEISLKRMMKNKKVRLTKFYWRNRVRDLEAFRGYELDSLEFEANGEKGSTEAIQLIVEHNGQFKVAVLAP